MARRTLTIPPQVRLSYIVISCVRRSFGTSAAQASSSSFHRSDFGNQPFTGMYESGQPTRGPLAGASMVGAPTITPKMLKQHLDQFVVGQERAKKILSVAVYNHYQRIHELQRRDEEYEEMVAQQARREMHHRHPVEDEFPGQQHTIHLHPPQPPDPSDAVFSAPPIIDASPLTIEKSNIMLLGPSGVGKTLMAKTLARVLDVPFSMSDCTPFTQAGYIGEDADVCVQRLLAAANYDVAAAERGIICLDEIDKIATAKVSHGKDVSGEGVQQALLKIIEGTTLQVQAKQERGSLGRNPGGGLPGQSNLGGSFPHPGGGGGGIGPTQPGGKAEVYNIRTDNILFIFTGAFIGLHKMILDRISKGSIGFGAPIRTAQPESGVHETTLKGEEELFKKHLPYYAPEPENGTGKSGQAFNALDLVEPADLQKYGMIPELVGRIPISCALSALDEDALVRVLTEPRNSLIRQYEQLFALSGIELKFTSGALREVAKAAMGMGTGARGLRTVLERLLGDAMFETPGSSVKHILITQAVAQRKRAPIYMARGQSGKFHSLIAAEEEEWAQRQDRADQARTSTHNNFQEYREKTIAAGCM